jgi:formaldehyde-activating enzyme involved in methanogenesis
VAAADGHTPLLVSSTGNVALKSGTLLLLIAHGEDTAEGGAAAGTVGHATGASSNPIGLTGG